MVSVLEKEKKDSRVRASYYMLVGVVLICAPGWRGEKRGKRVCCAGIVCMCAGERRSRGEGGRPLEEGTTSEIPLALSFHAFLSSPPSSLLSSILFLLISIPSFLSPLLSSILFLLFLLYDPGFLGEKKRVQDDEKKKRNQAIQYPTCYPSSR